MAKHKKVNMVLFICYAALMLWLLFHRTGAIEGVAYWEQIEMSLNLKPFHTVLRYARLLDSSKPHLVRLAVINLLGNVVMFIPLGFFFPLVFGKLRKLWRTLLLSAVTVTLVEILQLFTLMGSCDIDDLILNLVGSAIGYAMYRLTCK